MQRRLRSRSSVRSSTPSWRVSLAFFLSWQDPASITPRLAYCSGGRELSAQGGRERARSGRCGKVEREIAAISVRLERRLGMAAYGPLPRRPALYEQQSVRFLSAMGFRANEHKAKAKKSQAPFSDDLELISSPFVSLTSGDNTVLHQAGVLDLALATAPGM